MVKLAPSILSADFTNLLKDVQLVEEAGVDYLHIDVMDGHFVPNITIGPMVVAALRPHSQLGFDVHLMIENPDRYIDQFAQAGANIITVHVETCSHLHRTVSYIKEKKLRAGVALNPATSLSTIKWILPLVDLVLLMSVNPGFSGQAFIPLILPKINSLKEMLVQEGMQTEIEVDGGIGPEVASQVVQAGANVLVAGSAIFSKPDPVEAIAAIKAAIGSF